MSLTFPLLVSILLPSILKRAGNATPFLYLLTVFLSKSSSPGHYQRKWKKLFRFASQDWQLHFWHVLSDAESDSVFSDEYNAY